VEAARQPGRRLMDQPAEEVVTHPNDGHYQMIASLSDDAVYGLLKGLQEGVDKVAPGTYYGAMVAGAVMGLVRFTIETMTATKTVRNVLGVLLPSINRAAEQIISSPGRSEG
jgi:hypothetical protein